MLVSAIVTTGANEDTIKYDNAEKSYLISVKAQPIDGRANKAVAETLATYFDVPKSTVVLKRGATSRYKFFQIQDLI